MAYVFPGVGCKAYYVEVALNEVDDHVLPNKLLVFCRRVVSEKLFLDCLSLKLLNLSVRWYLITLTCISSE